MLTALSKLENICCITLNRKFQLSDGVEVKETKVEMNEALFLNTNNQLNTTLKENSYLKIEIERLKEEIRVNDEMVDGRKMELKGLKDQISALQIQVKSSEEVQNYYSVYLIKFLNYIKTIIIIHNNISGIMMMVMRKSSLIYHKINLNNISLKQKIRLLEEEVERLGKVNRDLIKVKNELQLSLKEYQERINKLTVSLKTIKEKVLHFIKPSYMTFIYGIYLVYISILDIIKNNFELFIFIYFIYLNKTTCHAS